MSFRAMWLAFLAYVWRIRANAAIDQIRESEERQTELGVAITREQHLRSVLYRKHRHACNRVIDLRSRLQRETHPRNRKEA